MLLSLDSLSITPLRAGQVRRIEAPEYLSPTTAYGVTFERGLEVVFGDRSHLYISGTASINNRGEVLHIGDVEAQTRRTLENVRALLATRNAGVNDLAYIIAYARNFHDRKRIDAVLCEESGGNTPIIFVEAPVCRPSWLVELEGMAIIPGASEFPAFL
jgi:enamine deaminase RidA (YjgF/YER057c/UK114 family)